MEEPNPIPTYHARVPQAQYKSMLAHPNPLCLQASPHSHRSTSAILHIVHDLLLPPHAHLQPGVPLLPLYLTETTSSSLPIRTGHQHQGQKSEFRNIQPHFLVISARKSSHEPTIFAHTFEPTQTSVHSSALSAPRHSQDSMTANVTKAFIVARRSSSVVANLGRVLNGDVAAALPVRMLSADISAAKPGASA